MTSLLRFAIDFIPWALSFPLIKYAVFGLLAMFVCFGGYVYFTGQSARTEVEVLKRVSDTVVREKQATVIRIDTDAKVSSKTHKGKVRELSRWAIKD